MVKTSGIWLFMIRSILLIFCVFGMISGCGKKPPPPQLKYAKDAITIEYQAEKELNMYNRNPHTLMVVLYQLSEVNAFNNLAASKDGLVQLLSAKSFDPSVTTVIKKYLEPGSSGSWIVDRAEKTQHVGMVAGFYTLSPDKSAILVDITYDTSRHGWLLKKTTTVNPLDVKLIFGKDGVRLKEEKSDS